MGTKSDASEDFGPPLRLERLELEAVGPFDHASIEFAREGAESEAREDAAAEPSLVTLITGQNGTGKSVVLDAVRTLFGEEFSGEVRPLWRFEPGSVLRTLPYQASLSGRGGHAPGTWGSRAFVLHDATKVHRTGQLAALPSSVRSGPQTCPPAVFEYWSPALGTGRFVGSLEPVEHRTVYTGALSGVVDRRDVARTLVHFEWLRSDPDPAKKALGEALSTAAAQVVEKALQRGKLTRIDRDSFTPMVEFDGRELPLDRLGAGSTWLLERSLLLLRRMYSVAMLSGFPVERMRELPGVLLIDEPEAHLHPRMQRRVLPILRELFPQVQLIAVTHSPFVLASVHRPRVYVCRTAGEGAALHSVIEEVSESYANRPIDEILTTRAFDETWPYAEEIAKLLDEHRTAPAHRRRELEAKLLQRNPMAFAGFRFEQELRELYGERSDEAAE